MKKLISIILSVAMLVTMLAGVTAFAEETTTPSTVITKAGLRIEHENIMNDAYLRNASKGQDWAPNASAGGVLMSNWGGGTNPSSNGMIEFIVEESGLYNFINVINKYGSGSYSQVTTTIYAADQETVILSYNNNDNYAGAIVTDVTSSPEYAGISKRGAFASILKMEHEGINLEKGKIYIKVDVNAYTSGKYSFFADYCEFIKAPTVINMTGKEMSFSVSSGSDNGLSGNSRILVPGNVLSATLDITDPGVYQVSISTITFEKDSAVKVFVNNIPMGIQNLNTTNKQQSFSNVIGEYEFLEGSNKIHFLPIGDSSIYFSSITLRKIDELRYDNLTVLLNKRIEGSTTTHTLNLPEDAKYRIYLMSRDTTTPAKFTVAVTNSATNTSANPYGTTLIESKQISGIDEWGAFDKVYMGDIQLLEGDNQIWFHKIVASGQSVYPEIAAYMIEKIDNDIIPEYISGFGNWSDMGKDGQALHKITIPEDGYYEFTATCASTGGEEAGVTVFIDEGNNVYPGVTANFNPPDSAAGAYSSFVPVTIGTMYLPAGTRDIWVKSPTTSIRVTNFKATKLETVKNVTMYFGEEVDEKKVMTSLRNGKITVQAELSDAAPEDCAVIAAIYEGGTFKGATLATADGNLRTATIDASQEIVKKIYNAQIKIFVLESEDTPNPLKLIRY